MKKIFYTLLAGAIALASCSKSDELSAIDPNSTQTTFTLAVESATPAPQAKSSRTTSTVAPERYVMEVWSADGLTPENVFDNGATNHAQSTSGSFTITLDKAKAYTCLFWADDNGTTYDAASLKAITVKSGKEAKEAYHAKTSVPAGNNPAITITLKRAVAKVTLEAIATLETGKVLTASYKQISSFSVLDGKATGTPADKIQTITIGNTQTGKFAEFYMLTTADYSLCDFSFVYNGEPAKVVTNVPVQQNYITNIKGEYSSSGNFTFDISDDDMWNSSNNEETVETYYAIGDYYPNPTDRATAEGIVYWLTNPVDKNGVKKAAHGMMMCMNQKYDYVSIDENWQTLQILRSYLCQENSEPTVDQVSPIIGKMVDGGVIANYALCNWLYTTVNSNNKSGKWVLPPKKEMMAIDFIMNGNNPEQWTESYNHDTESFAAFNAKLEDPFSVQSSVSYDTYYFTAELGFCGRSCNYFDFVSHEYYDGVDEYHPKVNLRPVAEF